MNRIAKWSVFEVVLQSQTDYSNPLWDVSVQAHFTGPGSQIRTVDAFWDGGRCWRVRFCPDAVGPWKWQSECSNADDAGLSSREGAFECTEYTGDNPLYRWGPLEVVSGRYFRQAEAEEPFFWLADTAWNGALRSEPDHWQRYLACRRRQRFTVIQLVVTHWRAFHQDARGRTAFTDPERARINPDWFQRLDAKIAAVNEHGLVAAPIILWSYGDDSVGMTVSEESAVRVARYIVARWGAHNVVWTLGGDGDYQGEKCERWKRIGRAVFGDRHDRLVTMHPMGQTWVGEEFRGEPWFDFIGYQSGHSELERHLHWLVEGQPATQWANEPRLPVINLEPNYELHPAYGSKVPFTDRKVRRAAYWSLMVHPAAGVTYGCNPIWNWGAETEVPEGHPTIGPIEPWQTGLDLPGVGSMTIMRDLMSSWYHLRPAPELLVEQPGTNDPSRFVAAAMEDPPHPIPGDEPILSAWFYLPCGGKIDTDLTPLVREIHELHWLNPRTGDMQSGGIVEGRRLTFTAPDENDWLLMVGAPR